MGSPIGDRYTQATSYLMLGAAFCNFGKYSKANEYNKKALAIFRDIGVRDEVAKVYSSQGHLLLSLRRVIEAKGYFEKALAISTSTGNRDQEAKDCHYLGCCFFMQEDYASGEEYIKKALTLSEDMGEINQQFIALAGLALIRMRENKIQEAISYFLSGIEKCETMRDSLLGNDQFKVSFLDYNVYSYRQLSRLLCATGNSNGALYVSELWKARALADLMLGKYSVQNRISSNPQTWAGLEEISAKECNGTCLCVSYICGFLKQPESDISR